MNRRPYAFRTKHDTDTDTWTFTLAHITDDEVAGFGLVFGDYVHNLRSALDHLVWAMAVNNLSGKEPSNANEINFPVADNYPAFVDAPALRALTWEQATVIERFQPYRGGDAPNPLRDLNAFWNDDKHRLVHPVIVRASERSPVYDGSDVGEIEEIWRETKRPLKLDTEVACVRAVPNGPNPNVYMEEFPIQIAFGKRRRLIDEDVPTLRDITRDIVDRCAQFFR